MRLVAVTAAVAVILALGIVVTAQADPLNARGQQARGDQIGPRDGAQGQNALRDGSGARRGDRNGPARGEATGQLDGSGARRGDGNGPGRGQATGQRDGSGPGRGEARGGGERKGPQDCTGPNCPHK